MNFEENVLFCDNHILVLNKPAGMPTQPNESSEHSLECWGKKWVKAKYEKKGNVFLHALHRIDKPVSGVVLFARTSKALSRLNQSIRDHQFHKEYFALVEGEVHEDEGELEHYLEKGDFSAHVVKKDHPAAKLCKLQFRTLKRGRGHSLLKINLITGRYHQIRVQLAAEGFPILGDLKYGCKNPASHLFLHHASLTFPHPISEEKIQHAAPLPPIWQMQKSLF